ncbi:Putative Zn-dependent protease [Rhodovulum sp. P5]|nr:Putative Zn-dependent protease [Rhodovulum sp. P5]
MAPVRSRPFASLAGTLFLAVSLLLAPLPLRAQTLIRDAEIEHALRELTRPLANAAGVGTSSLKILVLNDSDMNAFVANGQTIIIHSGLILRLGSAAELQGVIAHELAHIANGHFARRLSNLQNARSAAALGLVASLAVAAAGGERPPRGWPSAPGRPRKGGFLPIPGPRKPPPTRRGFDTWHGPGLRRRRWWRCLTGFAGRNRSAPRGRIRMCAPIP